MLRPLSPIRLLAFLVLAFGPAAAQAAPCRSETFEGSQYTVCSFDLSRDDLRIFWRSGAGEPYRTFSALQQDLSAGGRTLTFAMNGGMYGDDLSPVGLYVEDGRELNAANTRIVEGSPGQIPNFYKRPNGVFYMTGDTAGIATTEAYLAAKPDADFATQSGPMLVIDGKIHPMFIPGSSDRKPRNGVGVSSSTQVHFAISEDWVNFEEFARFFRDKLGSDDALFLDGGTASGLFAPELGRNDPPGHGGYGPIIGVVE